MALGCTSYLCLLIYDLCTDGPITQQDRNYPSKIPSPSISFTFNDNFSIQCIAIWPNATFRSCNDKIQQLPDSQQSQPPLYGFWYTTDANFTTNIVDKKSPDLMQLEFNIFVNPNSSSLGLPITVRLYDGIVINYDAHDNHNMNNYVLTFGQLEFVSFKRWANTTLKLHNPANVFGAKPPMYNHNYYITSNLLGIQNLGNNTQAIFALSLQSSEVITTTELKKTTVLSIISALGGAIALIREIYGKFCPTIQPCKTVQEILDQEILDQKKKILDSREAPYSEVENEEVSLEQLRERQKALELFLHKYLDEAGYFNGYFTQELEGIKKVAEVMKKIKEWIQKKYKAFKFTFSKYQ